MTLIWNFPISSGFLRQALRFMGIFYPETLKEREKRKESVAIYLKLYALLEIFTNSNLKAHSDDQ